MSQRLEMYSCGTCGTVAEIMRSGNGVMACCGQDMQLLKEGLTDGAREKHLPVVEKTAQGYTVRVGSIAHPMEESHWIEWIELVADGVSYTRFLKPGEAPVADFCLSAENVYAREYCNLHGLWKSL